MLLALLVDDVALQWSFADFTFQVLPDKGVNSGSLLAMSFPVEPRLEAAQPDIAHGAATLARRDQKMIW